MDRFLHSSFPFRDCRRSTFQLACVWLIGLIAGSFIAVSSQSSCDAQIAASLIADGSFAAQLAIILLPLLCSALAVFIGRRSLLIIIAFIKAFLYAYIGTGILLSWGSAGWLVQLLLMFSDTLILPLLWWYWLKSPDSHQTLACTAVAAIPALAVICLDSYIILPVLANLT